MKMLQRSYLDVDSSWTLSPLRVFSFLSVPSLTIPFFLFMLQYDQLLHMTAFVFYFFFFFCIATFEG